MALTLNFRDITPEDTRILRMVALRNGKAEDYLCCDVTNEDGVTQTDEFQTSVEAALEIIDNLLAKGYTFVTVDELTID